MTTPPRTFQPSRLAAAKGLRSRTSKSIAADAEISDEWFSSILRGHKTPQPETVKAFAASLELPEAFFYRPIRDAVPVDAFHFRASSKLAKRDEGAAQALALVAMELCAWMEENYDLPKPAVPEIQEITDAEIGLDPDTASEALRAVWGLGLRPIPDLMRLLEAKGVRIFSAGGPIDNIDAFSFRVKETPVIFLNVHKSAERLRFDLAHELGHLLLHNGSLNIESSKEKEREANDFASAFLMPRDDVLAQLPRSMTFEYVMHAKARWGVSAMALVYRVHKLGGISDWVYRSLCQQLATRGFRSAEPITTLQPEVSRLLTQLFDDLRGRGGGFLEVARALDVRAQDVRALTAGIITGVVSTGTDGAAQSSPRSSSLRAL